MMQSPAAYNLDLPKPQSLSITMDTTAAAPSFHTHSPKKKEKKKIEKAGNFLKIESPYRLFPAFQIFLAFFKYEKT